MGCGPGDHPREPHSRPKHGLKRGVPRRRSRVGEWWKGAEVVHTVVAMMRPVGAIASWSDASLFGRVAGCRGADLPRLIEELPHQNP